MAGVIDFLSIQTTLYCGSATTEITLNPPLGEVIHMETKQMILILLGLILVIITLAILLTVFIVWWKREKDWALTWHNSYTYTYSQYLQLVRVGETAQLRCSKVWQV